METEDSNEENLPRSSSNTDLEDDSPIENNPFYGVNIERRSTTKSIPKEIELREHLTKVTESIIQVEDTSIEKLLNIENINPMFRTLKLTTLNPIDRRANELEEILDDDDDYEFDQVFRANNDDAHAFGQNPITFLRKLLAIVCYPRLLADNAFPEDVKTRARNILKGCKGNSIGSVTEPAGIEIIREHVSKFIENRDNVNSKWQDVILTAGSSEAMKAILKLIACNINGKKSGVMLPIPTKQLYREQVHKNNMYQINYYLNESNNWSIDIGELNRAYDDAILICNPRAIIVINPGNPTGQILTRDNIEEIVKFAYDKRLLICADEINQFEIFFDEIEFVSFKKVVKELGIPYSKMELASFISASTGYISERGLRGGCVEFINVTADVKDLFLTYMGTKVCPPILGQVAIEVLVNPPLPEEPSYDEYMYEKEKIINMQRIQAGMLTVAFNNFTNFTCTPIMAGRHAFPSINMPQTAITAAEEVNQHPDIYFTTQLLEEKGICVAPGSEYGQKEDTYHLCLALVLPPDDLNLMLGRFKSFNQRFNERFSCKCKKKKAPAD